MAQIKTWSGVGGDSGVGGEGGGVLQVHLTIWQKVRRVLIVDLFINNGSLRFGRKEDLYQEERNPIKSLRVFTFCSIKVMKKCKFNTLLLHKFAEQVSVYINIRIFVVIY